MALETDTKRRMHHICDCLVYHGEDPGLRDRIVNVLSLLPDDVTDFALDRCAFLSVGKASAGMVLPGRIGVHGHEKRSRNFWLVLLDENMPGDDSVIAHEIAHAWLRHDRLAADDCETWERDAADLARSWGFVGRGTDVEFCEGPYRR